MHWVRSNIRFGTRVALIALALQIVLSFGHVHLAAIDPDAARASVGPVAGAGDTTSPRSHSPTHKSGDPNDAFCAICASIRMVAGSVPAAGPTLPLPAEFNPIDVQAPALSVLASAFRTVPNARAPPPA